MKIYSLLALALIGLATAVVPDLDDKWCRSCDDPHMTTFDQTNYEFQHVGDNYVMYNDASSDITVTTGYRNCNGGNGGPTCNCAVGVEYNGDRLVLDVCGIQGTPANLQFHYFIGLASTVVDCSLDVIPVGQETDDDFWNTVQVFSLIKCAKVSDNNYMIRTNHPANNVNIYVKLFIHASGISCVNVRPPSSIYLESAGYGLCGNFDDNPGNDFTDPNGAIITAPGMTVWQLTNPSANNLVLENEDCPTGTPSSDGSCGGILRSEYLANLIQPPVPVVHQDSVRSEEGRKGQNAKEVCIKMFNKLNLDALEIVLTQEQQNALQNWCNTDFEQTGDFKWIFDQAQIAKNWALETCAKQAAACKAAAIPTRCEFQKEYLAINKEQNADLLAKECANLRN